jgi:UDPglucose 6-dehydrogenase
MNDHQKRRFAKNIVRTRFIIPYLAIRNSPFLGWAFKKDTNDTRESAAIYVANDLLFEQAKITVFDPKVTEQQMLDDMNYLQTRSESENARLLEAATDPYLACEGAHAIAVLTEWDEFKDYDWETIYHKMNKPAFVFDGRNVLDGEKLTGLGFIYQRIGA